MAGCRESMEKLRGRGVGTMLNYSAEAELGAEFDSEKLELARLEEVERALDEAGRFERDVEAKGGMAGSTAFALKIVRRFLCSHLGTLGTRGLISDWLD